MAGALLGIGTLHQLTVLDPLTRKQRTMTLRNRWLAWDGRAFHICIPKRRAKAGLPDRIRKAHRRFHQAETGAALEAEVPTAAGKLTQLGLLKALVYRVPQQVKSPEKNPYVWHHAFGDTGHQGGDSYPDKVMPALVKDAKGNLFIKRRKGNIFRVDTWLRG